MTLKEWVAKRNEALYGLNSVFTPEEQAAMRRGYTTKERLAISGCQYGIYPQAISQAHADKLDALIKAVARGWEGGL